MVGVFFVGGVGEDSDVGFVDITMFGEKVGVVGVSLVVVEKKIV